MKNSNRKIYYLTREYRVKLTRFSKFKFDQESGRRRTTGIEMALIHYVNVISQNKLHLQKGVNNLFAANLFCLLQLYFICSNFFYLWYVPCGPPSFVFSFLFISFNLRHSFHRIWKKKCRILHNSELFLKCFNGRDYR